MYCSKRAIPWRKLDATDVNKVSLPSVTEQAIAAAEINEQTRFCMQVSNPAGEQKKRETFANPYNSAKSPKSLIGLRGAMFK